MFPRIKRLKTMDDYRLFVVFDDDRCVIYDVSEDIETIPAFSALKTEIGLWNCVQLDESRTCVFWSDMIDLPSDTILEYGEAVSDMTA